MSDKPALSYSIAKILLGDSPRHAWCAHPLLGNLKGEPTVAMEFGDVAHQLMLGQGRGFSIWEGKDWRGKEAGEFWDKAVADHLTPIKRADYTNANTLVSEVRRQLGEMGLGHVFSEGGSAEEKFRWLEGGVECSAKLDWYLLKDNRAEIWDFKVTNCAHPKSVAKRIGNDFLDVEEEFHTRALAAAHPELQGRITFRFLFADDSFPFCITPYENDGLGRGIGLSKVERALSLWRACLESGKWPGYASGIVKGETPKWALDAEFGADPIHKILNT